MLTSYTSTMQGTTISGGTLRTSEMENLGVSYFHSHRGLAGSHRSIRFRKNGQYHRWRHFIWHLPRTPAWINNLGSGLQAGMDGFSAKAR